MTRTLYLSATAWLMLVLVAVEGAAQDNPQPTADSAVEREYARFQEIAADCRIETAGGVPLELQAKSLMNWTNPARNSELGSVYVWESNGRPEVIGTVFTYESAKLMLIRTKLALHSLCDEGLTATRDDAVIWRPRAPGVHWLSADDGTDVAKAAPLRLGQMRALAREFQVEMELRPGETETLRLLPQPLYRYQPTAGAVKDGALFAFVTGTDPEALLMVEAVDQGGQLAWRAAFIRFHYVSIVARKNGVEVWRAAPEPDQRVNTVGDEQFQERVYSTMVVAESPAPPR